MSKTRESRQEFWRRLVAEQQQSGVSVRAICRQRGASEHSFYQWRKRLAASFRSSSRWLTLAGARQALHAWS